MTFDPGVDPVAIDVAGLVERSVASLHSYLVTRPTGQAVRLAIEGQLPAGGRTALSVVDLSRVMVLDFSCADEVIAKLLLRYLPDLRPRDAYFLFRGMGPHMDPVESVLERHGLAAVGQDPEGRFGLVGVRSSDEDRVWSRVEAAGVIAAVGVDGPLDTPGERVVAERLVQRRLILQAGDGTLHALSRLARGILPG